MNLIAILFIVTIINLGMLLPNDFAYPIKDGERSMGVFQPRIYGIKDKMELSTHPIIFLIRPNAKLKIFHGERKEIGIASRYSFDYPTLFFKLIQHRGYFGFISEDPDISEIQHLLVIKGEILGTKIFLDYSISGKMGFSICPGCKLDSRHIIDYDLMYPRMALYHHGIGANMGLDWDYIHTEKISLKVDMDLLLLPKEHAFFEHKFLLHYNFSKKYFLSTGYKFSYGYYPFDKNNGLWNLFPIIDLSWYWIK